MKVRQIISLVDGLRENKIDDETKLFWINEIEGRIQNEIFKSAPGVFKPLISLENEVSAPEQYSRIYVLYLDAMILFGKGEYDSFHVVTAELERAFSEYARYIIRNRI